MELRVLKKMYIGSGYFLTRGEIWQVTCVSKIDGVDIFELCCELGPNEGSIREFDRETISDYFEVISYPINSYLPTKDISSNKNEELPTNDEELLIRNGGYICCELCG